MVNKETIKKSFSRYAEYYDRYSAIQNICALKLIGYAGVNNFREILDIGCGTGNYTGLLRDEFPRANIKAVDISEEMVEIAKKKLGDENIKFSIADAQTLNLKERFDLISSNAVFQWFGNLEKTLFGYRKLLNKGGVISFSIFGPRTFCELNEALKKAFGQGARVSASGFTEKAEIEKTLRALFGRVKVTEEIFKERYTSLAELFKKIKYTGTRGSAAVSGKFWTPKAVSKVEKAYKKEYKNIVAAYQVFFCRGQN